MHHFGNSVTSIHLISAFQSALRLKMNCNSIHLLMAMLYIGAEFAMASLPGASKWDAYAKALENYEVKFRHELCEDVHTMSGDLDFLETLLDLDIDLKSLIEFLEYQEQRAQFLRSKLYLFRDGRASDYDFTRIDRHLTNFQNENCQKQRNFQRFDKRNQYNYTTSLLKDPFEKWCGSEEGVKFVQEKLDSLLEGYPKLIQLKSKLDLECKEIKAMWDELPKDDRREHDEKEL